MQLITHNLLNVDHLNLMFSSLFITYSINKSNLNTILIKILTIVTINFKLLLNIKNKCAICQDKIFASFHCANCEGNGLLLCYEHFLNGPWACSLIKYSHNLHSTVGQNFVPRLTRGSELW